MPKVSADQLKSLKKECEDRYTVYLNEENPFVKPSDIPDDLEVICYLVNTCYGGFSLSEKATEMIETKKKENGNTEQFRYYEMSTRTDPDVVEVVLSLGKEANGTCADITPHWIPKTCVEKNMLTLSEYDGTESLSIDVQAVYIDALENLLLSD